MIGRPRQRLAELVSTRLAFARQTGWALVADQSQMVLGMLVFLSVARALGSESYAVYGAVIASIAIASMISTLGVEWSFGREIARIEDPGLAEHLAAQARAVTLAGGVAATCLLVALAPVVFPDATSLDVAMLAASELLLVRVVRTTVTLRQLAGLQRDAASAQALLFLPRAVFAAGFLLLISPENQTIRTWVLMYAAAAAIGAVAAWVATGFELQSRAVAGFALTDVRSGLPFGINLVGTQARTDIDKPMMANLAPLADAGSYQSAYRLITVASSPVRALSIASYGRFFRTDHPASALARARRSIAPVVLYGLAAAAALTVASPLVVTVLGSSFAEADDAVRWLALVPLVRGLQVIPGNALSGLGFQHQRAAASWAATGVNVVVNIALIGAYSWRGAVVATMVAECALAGYFWLDLSRRARSTDPADWSAPEGDIDTVDEPPEPHPGRITLLERLPPSQAIPTRERPR